MDNDVHSLPADQIGKALGAEVEKQRLDLRGKSVAEIASILTSPPIGRDYGVDEPLPHAPPVAPSSSPVAPDASKLTNAAPVTPSAEGLVGPKQHLDLRDKSVAEIVSILMSPPIGRDYGIHEALAHAPAVAPASSAVAPDPTCLDNALPVIPQIANAPPMAPGSAGPNLDLKSRPAEGKIPFEHVRASRPLHDQGPLVARFGRLSLVVILAAIIAIGLTLMTFSNEVREHLGDIFGKVAPRFEDPTQVRTPTKLPRLVIKAQKGFVNEPLPLGVSINDASGQETVVLAGLAIGTTLSTGTPLGFTSWEMLARDVGNAFVYAPKDFVGVMVAAIDLRSPSNWLIDNQTVRLEWSQRPSVEKEK